MDSSEQKSLLALPFIFILAGLVMLAGSQGGLQLSNIPILALCVVVIFLIQWLAFIPAYIKETEKYFDLTGSLTYLFVIIMAGIISGKNDTRTLILQILVGIWALRLGIFLFNRVRTVGEDIRFKDIKVSFVRFFVTWNIQALWIVFTLAACLAAITTNIEKGIDFYAILGLILWIIGFTIEIVADWQKDQFRKDPTNAGKFIHNGLWAWSRHPNYFGEILLWFGIAIIAFPVLNGWQYVTLISPIFVFLLLTKVSGIPMLEKKSDEKWGGQEDYERYKRNTPALRLKRPH